MDCSPKNREVRVQQEVAAGAPGELLVSFNENRVVYPTPQVQQVTYSISQRHSPVPQNLEYQYENQQVYTGLAQHGAAYDTRELGGFQIQKEGFIQGEPKDIEDFSKKVKQQEPLPCQGICSPQFEAQNWVLPFEKENLHELAFQGGIGHVYQACSPGGTIIVKKICLKRYRHSEVMLPIRYHEKFGRQGKTGMAEIFGMYVCPGEINILEKHAGPNLEKWNFVWPKNKNLIVDILRKSLICLKNLHQIGFVHADIKPANMALDGDQFTLIDSGSAHSPLEENPGTGLTLLYLPPEYLKHPLELTDKGDVFSLGLSVMYLMTGKHALCIYARENKRDLQDPSERRSVVKTVAKDPTCLLKYLPSGCSAEWKSLIAKMLLKDPRGRISALQALQELELLIERGRQHTEEPMDFTGEAYVEDDEEEDDEDSDDDDVDDGGDIPDEEVPRDADPAPDDGPPVLPDFGTLLGSRVSMDEAEMVRDSEDADDEDEMEYEDDDSEEQQDEWSEEPEDEEADVGWLNLQPRGLGFKKMESPDADDSDSLLIDEGQYSDLSLNQ